MQSNFQPLSACVAIIPYLLILHVYHPCASTPQISETSFKTFSVNDGIKFNHLAIDKDRGLVFIGAVNHLYQLSANLEPITNLTTGPVEDALECSRYKCSPDVTKRPTDNHNKALLVDYYNSRLIVCGSVFQGSCSVHLLQNVSNVTQVVGEHVVANNANASTVAFMVPSYSTPAMCVGTTYTGNSHYRSEIPAVASRSLQDSRMLSIFNKSISTGTQMFISTLFRERYIVNYVFGFSSGINNYFLTTQMKHTAPNSPYISKLIRICNEDMNYFSYTEIPIECAGSGGRQYNLAQAAFVGKPGAGLAAQLDILPHEDVLFVVFSQSEQVEGENANKPSSNSALCIYSLKSINRMFLKNINNCARGKGTLGLDFITPDRNCMRTRIEDITEDFCGLDINNPLGGPIPVTAVTAVTYNKRLTAVAANSASGATVVFIGTYEGHLKKVVIEYLDHGVEYDDIVIDQSPINSDMLFDFAAEYLYVMTEHKLTKVKVENCGKHKSCWNCLSAKDPYCGWYFLENKCSSQKSCKDTDLWISPKTGECVSIASISPKELQRTTVQTLTLIVNNLPSLPGQFLCVFTIFDEILVTNATRSNLSISCNSPATDLLPSVPLGQHHFTARLSVKSNHSKIVNTNLTFFDCNSYTTCISCVSSTFPCDWCVDAHRCTHIAESCRNDVIITGVNHSGPSYRSGPTFCPAIYLNINGSREILIADGSKKAIKVHAHLGSFVSLTRFLCQFNMEGHITNALAQLLGDNLYCDSMEFSFSQRAPNVTVPFSVVWGGSKPLDNPENIHILLYRCRDMADSCGMCSTLDKKFGCGWCLDTNSCEINDQCGNGIGNWLKPSDTCPNPTILSFDPYCGSWEGGTNITVRGINLGKSFHDIYGGITVAGISCEPYEHLYKTTREIVCQVDGPGTSQIRHGPVLVKVENFRGQSKKEYQFVDPKIEDIFPRHGPISGGTLLSVKGKYMNCGSHIEVYIDDLPCQVVRINAAEIQCLTSPSKGRSDGRVKVIFDRSIRLYDKDLFEYEYVADPTIDSLESGNNCYKYPKGIPAGGVRISVTGTNFLTIQGPKFYLYNENRTKQYFSDCEVYNDSLLTCPSPYIPELYNSTFNSDEPKRLDYGFVMDNVVSLQNLSFSSRYPKLFIYPNPIFHKFHRTLRDYKSDYLIINGMNIDRACQESDIAVLVGNKSCTVTSLSKQQLTCKLPKEEAFPSPLQKVVVAIGQHFQVPIGNIKYSTVGAYNDINKSSYDAEPLDMLL